MSSIAPPRNSNRTTATTSAQKAKPSISKQWAAAEAARNAAVGQFSSVTGKSTSSTTSTTTAHASTNVAAVSGTTPTVSAAEQRIRFTVRQGMLMVFFGMIAILHVLGLYLFTNGFLLTRMVLLDKSECAVPPIDVETNSALLLGNVHNGCWHPRTFEKAIVIVIDALRYDFTVPFQRGEDVTEAPRHYHDALRVLYETAVATPENAVLLPFLADPPTTTLQRLKGLTTGTLPTFVEAGSNFGGEAIEEDNLLSQLRAANRTIVHLGDNTWHALFPGYFETEMTRPYDSFNVWDLHTVDNGVIEHLAPLLKPDNASRWDLLIGHLLGVDHAGHRYGPDHPAMAAKLVQMDTFVRKTMDSIDDDTLLIVMGDHGMDAKGDHGGESDEEIQAALWMYSKRPTFGHRAGIEIGPPLNANNRNVAQIDLVPTLALLLGLPIPFNNLGSPIFEAFAGVGKTSYENLARVQRLTAAQIQRYMTGYSSKRDLGDRISDDAWVHSNGVWDAISSSSGRVDPWQAAYLAYQSFQLQTLGLCKELWAQFNVTSMIHGIEILALGLVLLLVYSRGVNMDYMELTPTIVGRGVVGLTIGAIIGAGVSSQFDKAQFVNILVYTTAIGGSLAIASGLIPKRNQISIPLPRSTFAWVSIITTLGLSLGFASNSYTIWEDKILVFFLGTISLLLAAASLRQERFIDRTYGCYHAILLGVLTRISSLSRLCREEQMPYCESTFYSSSTSSKAALWHLAIPTAVSLLLPAILKQYYENTSSWHQAAPLWFGYMFRGSLSLSAAFWILSIADDKSWLPIMSTESVLSGKLLIAQTSLGVSIAVGYALYAWSAPFLDITTKPLTEREQTTPQSRNNPQLGIRSPDGQSRLTVHGLLNVHGTRYFPLLTIWTAAIILFQKPLGGGTIALLLWQILSLAEVLAATGLSTTSSIGPITLALLASFHFFTTGHQATLSSIQWDAAFIPLRTVSQPWSAICLVLNTFAAHILCALAAPLLPLWRAPARSPRLFSAIAKSAATFLVFFTTVALATCFWAMWLRRHLMLFRVFCPRFLLAGTGLVVVDVVMVLLVLGGLRWWGLSVGEVLGYPD